jgi:hypothetical protein
MSEAASLSYIQKALWARSLPASEGRTQVPVIAAGRPTRGAGGACAEEQNRCRSL